MLFVLLINASISSDVRSLPEFATETAETTKTTKTAKTVETAETTEATQTTKTAVIAHERLGDVGHTGEWLGHVVDDGLGKQTVVDHGLLEDAEGGHWVGRQGTVGGAGLQDTSAQAQAAEAETSKTVTTAEATEAAESTEAPKAETVEAPGGCAGNNGRKDDDLKNEGTNL